MIDIYGWWAFDPENEALVNTLSGERVRFHSKLSSEEATGEGEWLRFQYEHEDLSYPLLVETGPTIYDIFDGKYRAPSNAKITISDDWAWQLDHIRSAKLWCQEGSLQEGYPSYGLWRRVDDCVNDALCFWPERGITGLGPKRILIAGGWVNGQWSDLWERMYSHWVCYKNSNNRSGFKPSDLTKSWLCPLDEPAPSPWEFHDCETGDKEDLKGFFNFNDRVFFPQRRSTLSSKEPRLYFLPKGVELTGFERETVYLQTRDKKKVIAYKGVGYADLIHMDIPIFEFLYGDENITASFSGSSSSANVDINSRAPIDWSIDSFSRGSTRFDLNDLDEDTCVQSLIDQYSPHNTWMRTASTVRDAFLQFSGSRYRSKDWDSWLTFRPTDVISFRGGYRAGVWMNDNHCASRYLKYPQSLYNREIKFRE